MNRKSWSLRLAIILVLSLFAFACTDPAPEDDYTEEPAPTRTPRSSSESSGGDGDTWLVMLYEDADDSILEKDMFIDLNEAETIGSNDNVTIVAQMDRYKGGFRGDGNWTTTKRFLIQQDSDLSHIKSEEIKDLGELDMSDPKVLVDFATWAIKKYPADHYVLILSDHGGGWTGGWTDDNPREGGSMTVQDIDNALNQIVSKSKIGQFDLVGFDACLMAQLEVVSAVAPYAQYTVLSEETEPAVGWAYADMLGALQENPDMSARDLAKAIVSGYIVKDIRITDAKARQAFLKELGEDSDMTAKELAREMSYEVTLSAVDLSKVRALNVAFNEVITLMTQAQGRKVARARSYAESYTSVFGDEFSSVFIDLGHFADLLSSEVDDPEISDAARALKKALGQAVIAEMHGSSKSASTGLSFYFPNSKLYKVTARKGDIQYTAYVGRFAAASLWDDYLAYYYAKKEFDPDTADLSVLDAMGAAQNDFSRAIDASEPAADAEIESPGTGTITIDPLEVSADEIGLDDLLTVSTVVHGENISYVYYYVSYYDEESDTYLTADMGFIQSDETKEVSGVYYPDWGEDTDIPIEFDWEPTLYFMSDGDEANDQFAYFEPEVYGASVEADIYSVWGTYTFVEDGSSVEAVIKFSGDGQMLNIFGFAGDDDDGGTPHEIIPQVGDTFIITEEWLEFDQDPEGEFVDYDGGTMTFNGTRFEMVPYEAYPGRYILGVIVEDMNGNYSEEFIEITVRE